MDKLNIDSLQDQLALVDMLTRPSRSAAKYGLLEQLLLKKDNIKLKMYQERGHARPHFHVDYGKDVHTASYAIDTGDRIEGTLDRKYDKAVSSWAQENREQLLQVWTALQSGNDHEEYIQSLGSI